MLPISSVPGVDVRSASTAASMVRQYRRDGFLIRPGLLDHAEVDRLRAEALRICRGERGQVRGLTPAATREPDDEVLRRVHCIHYPHKLSELMLDALRHPAIVSQLTELIGPDVKAMQSMLFIKAKGKPGQAWHQDEFFIPTRDRSLTAAWIALDDATVDNGCLWALPGSHTSGVIYPNREHDNPDYDCSLESYGFPYADGDAAPLTLAAGSVVFFNGYLLHKSFPHRGQRGYRRALVLHYMNAHSQLPWAPPKPGQQMGQADFRDIVMVAGRDPYEWKGVEDVRIPMVRRDRDGGCDR